MIPYAKQNVLKEDIDAVISVLESDFLTQGPMVPKFEEQLKQKVGAEHAVVVNSATSALHLSCVALGLKTGDRVWTSPISFVASSNCALYCDAQVDFVDIDPRTYNMSPSALEEKLIHAEKNGELPKIVIVVHFAGQSCNMREIHRLSLKYDFKIIEDASHSIGASYNDWTVGCCKYSDITVFSFHPVKIITAGEGGAILTNNPILAQKIILLRSHGITREKELFSRENSGPWYYEQIDLGFNYRMTDIQAALGISQLNRLKSAVEKRNEIAGLYDKLLSETDVTLPFIDPINYSAFHLYVVRLNLENLKKSKRQIFELLHIEGVMVNLHYIPIYKQPYYRKKGFPENYCNEAEAYYLEAMSLPMYENLTESQVRQVTDSLGKLLD